MEYRRWKVRATSLVVLVILLVVASVRGNGVKVRLVDGSSPYDGVVELYVNDTTGWLPVCGTRGVWKFIDAYVVCNQLGYNGTMWSRRQNGLLRNDPRRVVDQVACTANSITIDDCTFNIEEPDHCNDAARITCNFDGYIGCFNNDASDPILPDDEEENDEMTIQWCLEYCRERNWTYAGLWRTYCHCGSQGIDYERHELPNQRCNTPCAENDWQICGGVKQAEKRISIYITHLGACGGQINVTGSQTIYSPGFPGYYPNSQDCTWTLISSSNTSNFMISFVFLNLSSIDDYVTLYNVIDGKLRIIRQFNGSDVPEVVLSCSSEVLVHFLSGNSSDQYKGMFALTFKEVYTACPLPTEIKYGHFNVTGDCTRDFMLSVTCNEGLQLSTSHSAVLCYENHGWNDTIPSCTASMGACGGRVNESGVIYSPGFPGNYPNNQNCTWILSASKNSTIKIEFLFLSFGGENDSVTMAEVIDGIHYDIGRFEKASELLEAIFSFSYEVYVTFNSEYGQDVSSVIFAFLFEEAEVGCQLPMGIENGNFRIIGNPPHSYSLNVTCREGFQATKPDTVTCKENRQWTSPYPKCLVIDCDEPDEVPNSSKEGDLYTYNNTVKYSCNDGYYMDGHDVITCEEDWNWSKQPTCILKILSTVVPIGEQMQTKTQTGAIVGSVIGVLIFIVLIIIIAILCRRKGSLKKVTRNDILAVLPRMKSRRQSDTVLAEKQSNEYQDSLITVIDMTDEGYFEGKTREDGTVPLTATNDQDQQQTSVRSEDEQCKVKKQGMGAWFKMKRKKTAKNTSEDISNLENGIDKDEDSRKRTLIERDKSLLDKGSYAPGGDNGDENPRYLENVGNHNGVTADHNHGHDTFQHSTDRGSRNAKINRSGRFKKPTSKSEINRDLQTAKSMDIPDTIAGKSALSEQMSVAGYRHNDTTTESGTPDELSEDDDPYSEIDSHGNCVEKLVDDSVNNKDVKEMLHEKEKYSGKISQHVLKELVHSESFRKRSLKSSTADHDKLRSVDGAKREPRSGDQFKMAENVLYDFGDDPENDKDGIYESVGDNEEGFVDNILYEPSGSDSKETHAADGVVSHEDAKQHKQTQLTGERDSSTEKLKGCKENRKATLRKVSLANTEEKSPMDLSTDSADDSDENNLYSEICDTDKDGFVDNVIYQDSLRESSFLQSKEHPNKGQEINEMFKDEELGEEQMVDNILYESAGSLLTSEKDNEAENQDQVGRHEVNIVKESDGKGQPKEGYLQKTGKIVLPSQAKSPDGRDQAPKKHTPKFDFQPPTFEKNQSNAVSENGWMGAEEDVVQNAKVHDGGKANVCSEMKTEGGDLQFEVDKEDRNDINVYDIVGGDDDEVEYELAGPNIGMTGSGTNISEHAAKNEAGYLDKGNKKSKPAMFEDSSKDKSDSLQSHTSASDVETRPTENASDKSFENLVNSGMVDNIIYESSNDLIGDESSQINARTMETSGENSEVGNDGPQGIGKLSYLAKLGQKVMLDELKSPKKPENSPSSVDRDKANIEEPFFKYTAEGKTEPLDTGAHLQKDSNNESDDRIDGHINTSETDEGIVDNVLYESLDSILGN